MGPNTYMDKQIREKLLKGGYGRFDLLELAFSKAELLGLKPRFLYNELLERFNLSKEDLSRQQLNSWHFRYRKAHDKNIKTNLHNASAGSCQNLERRAYNAAIDKELDIMKNLIPGDPQKSEDLESILIKVVITKS